MSITLRRATTVLAVASVAVGLATPGAALAAKKPTPTKKGGPSVTHTVHAPGYNARVEGGATGQGPGTESFCEGVADDVNAAIDEAESQALQGNEQGMVNASAAADALVDYGMDRGCFFTDVA